MAPQDYSDDPCAALYNTAADRKQCRRDSRVLTRQVNEAQAKANRKAARVAERQAATAARKAARVAERAIAAAARKAARIAARQSDRLAAKNKTPGVDIPWQNTDLA